MIPFKKNSIILAPMAGITDKGFRRICIECGADATVSEMVSAKGIFYKDKKSQKLLEYDKEEQPIALQIFGNDPESMKSATQYITENLMPCSIDINMGCPAPKIFQNGDGCALMKNLDLASEIIRSVKENTDLPVSVKFRSGVDDKNINAVEFAKMCEYSNADFITVHGRTREQFYSGKSDIMIIKKVVESVSIPVIANGDITDGKSAEETLSITGAHSIMVGRASLGNPQIFYKIKKHFYPELNLKEFSKRELALKHLEYTIADKGEILAVKEFRKHILWYLKGQKNASKLKLIANNVITYNDCCELLMNVE